MINSILLSVPPQYLLGISNGSLIRFGTIIKEVATGHIVGHLQETGLAQQLISGIGIPPFTPLGVAVAGLNLASSGYSNIQLSQMKSMMESMQLFQYANLGVSVAGIGVSVIGFAIINKRLKTIEGQISTLSEKMDSHFQVLFERELRKHFSQISALFEKADLAHALSNPSEEWLAIASQLADESGFFYGELADYLNKDSFDTDLFTALVRSMALCNAARIECLLLAEEMSAAYKTSETIGEKYKNLFDNISPFQLANKITYSDKNAERNAQDAFRKEQLDMNNLVQGIRDITDVSLTKPYLIKTLIDKGISGNEYLTTLKNEKDHPILFLKSN